MEMSYGKNSCCCCRAECLDHTSFVHSVRCRISRFGVEFIWNRSYLMQVRCRIRRRSVWILYKARACAGVWDLEDRCPPRNAPDQCFFDHKVGNFKPSEKNPTFCCLCRRKFGNKHFLWKYTSISSKSWRKVVVVLVKTPKFRLRRVRSNKNVSFSNIP